MRYQRHPHKQRSVGRHPQGLGGQFHPNPYDPEFAVHSPRPRPTPTRNRPMASLCQNSSPESSGSMEHLGTRFRLSSACNCFLEPEPTQCTPRCSKAPSTTRPSQFSRAMPWPWVLQRHGRTYENSRLRALQSSPVTKEISQVSEAHHSSRPESSAQRTEAATSPSPPACHGAHEDQGQQRSRDPGRSRIVRLMHCFSFTVRAAPALLPCRAAASGSCT